MYKCQHEHVFFYKCWFQELEQKRKMFTNIYNEQFLNKTTKLKYFHTLNKEGFINTYRAWQQLS